MAYVDKEKFKRKLQYIFKTYRMSEIITEKVKKALDDTTVDVVEVVRCPECVYCKTDTEYSKRTNSGYCEFDNIVHRKTHYCAYGERKEK